jgi:hypothetical protein
MEEGCQLDSFCGTQQAGAGARFYLKGSRKSLQHFRKGSDTI